MLCIIQKEALSLIPKGYKQSQGACFPPPSLISIVSGNPSHFWEYHTQNHMLWVPWVSVCVCVCVLMQISASKARASFGISQKSSRLFNVWVEFLSLLTGHSLLALIISKRHCIMQTPLSIQQWLTALFQTVYLRVGVIHPQLMFLGSSLFNNRETREDEHPNPSFFYYFPTASSFPATPSPHILALWVTWLQVLSG